MIEPLIYPVVLSGGSGTRLWPRSRKARPKPYLPLVDQRTLLEATIDRWIGRDNFASPTIVAGIDHLSHIAEQTGRDVKVIVEPEPKNTAPAIALAAALLPVDSILLVCPSDHHIADNEAFSSAARKAARLAVDDWMVAFAITPGSAETGYGYIRLGDPIECGHRIDRFVEKPDRITAESFLAEGGYSWNAGIFAFRAGAFLNELARHRPTMAESVREAVAGGEFVGRHFHPNREAFAAIGGESIDYAVMENSLRAAVVPADMVWSDVGNWEALRDARPADNNGNRTLGPAELVECSNVLVDTDGPRVSVIGLKNVIVVIDGDEVLVTSAAGAQLVGSLSGARNQ